MNRKQIDLDDAVGKTITAVIEAILGDGVILAIGDDEFVLVEADGDEDGGELRFDTHDTRFIRHRYRDYDLRNVFDEATLAEWDAKNQTKAANEAERRDREERALFERLKAKFGE